MGQKPGTNPNEWIPKCGRPRRGGKGPCKANCMKNGNGCRIHGGTTPTGLASANISDMPRYTLALKGTKLLDRYEAAQADTAILELKDEIGIVTGLIEELLTRLDDGESRASLKLILKCYDDMQNARIMEKWPIYNDKYNELGYLIKEAHNQFGIMADVNAAIKLRKELTEAQSKREIQLEQMMKAEDVIILLKVIIGEIRGIIYDRLDDRTMADALLGEITEKVAGHLRRTRASGTKSALPEG